MPSSRSCRCNDLEAVCLDIEHLGEAAELDPDRAAEVACYFIKWERAALHAYEMMHEGEYDPDHWPRAAIATKYEQISRRSL